MTMINNGFTLLGLDSTYEQIVQGRLASFCWLSVGTRGRRKSDDRGLAGARARTT
ncbi:hypothetical protein [Nocardioides sp.]|uniref:hypothetical protein n=1 Tax=Nocardioides sp. TaxID=35761 RepID=UPI003784CB3F